MNPWPRQIHEKKYDKKNSKQTGAIDFVWGDKRFWPKSLPAGESVFSRKLGRELMSCPLWLSRLTEGSRISAVAFTQDAMDDGSTKVLLHGMRAEALVLMSLPLRRHLSLYFLQVAEQDPLILCPTKDSKVLDSWDCTSLSIHRMIELCSGIAGISTGAMAAGFSACAYMDKNELACSHLKMMGKKNVLCGDVTKDKDILRLHCSLASPAHAVAAGFSCQPFSFQGDQKGFDDERSSSFWGTLRSFYMLQGRLLILECTPGAGQCEQLQGALRDFALRLGLQVHQTFIDLVAQWPSKRHRWWCVLYPHDWPSITLQGWQPADAFRSIRQIMPEWPVWPTKDLQQLLLTEYEKQLYFETFPDHARILDEAGVLPVILHSYGKAVQGCPCNCRLMGFRPERLRQAGLRGVLLRTEAGPRFLHPKELAFFLGFPLDLDFGEDLRASMCMLGQVASPLQAAWILSQVHNLLHELWNGLDWINPEILLVDLKDELLFQRHHLLPSFHWKMQTVLSLQFPDGQVQRIIKDEYQTVKDLLAAERINLDWNQQILLLDGGKPVPPQAFLRNQGLFGPYQLHPLPAPDRFAIISGLVMIQFDLSCGSQFVLVPAGTFLFEAWQKLCGGTMPSVKDTFQRVWRPDERCWTSLLLVENPSGAGQSGPGGLSLDFVDFVLQELDLHLVASCIYWHPDLEEPISNRLSFFLQQLDDSASLCLCLLADGHWQLLEGQWFSDGLRIMVSDGLSPRPRPHLTAFLTWIKGALPDPQTPLHVLECQPFVQSTPDACGTLMLGFLMQRLGLWGLDFDPTTHEAQHHTDLKLVEEEFFGAQVQPCGRGPSDDAQTLLKLTQLLIEKGVPVDKAEERASMGIKKIGIKEVVDALNNKNPWLYLKGVASRPHISFQWLKADELQTKIKARAASKFAVQPADKRKKKAGRSAQDTPLLVDPSQLCLVPNTFFAAGKAVAQIPFDQIGSMAEGLAFATVADVAPFLSAGVLVSEKALGVLTTTPIDQAHVNTMQVENFRYPAMYKATSEPVLVQGSLVTLGKVHISKGDAAVTCSLESIPTQTLRLAVYRDQWTGNWNMFTQQPMRQLLSKLPVFTLCRTVDCGSDCGRYHAPLEESLDQLILDLWSRTWHRMDLKFTKPDDAAIWSANIRVPATASMTLQKVSGQHGLYVEPRSDSGHDPDNKFGIVWLGNISLQEAFHKLKTTDHAIALGRAGQKYGLRLPVVHVEKAHALLKPDEEFSNTAIQSIYKIFPLPWGTQKAALQKCLKEFKWPVKILQVVGGGADGIGWEVGASQPPPSSVLQGPDGDAVITFVRSATREPKVNNVLAFASTKRHIKLGAPELKSDVDPLTRCDPWKGQTLPEKRSSAASASTDRITQMEDRLQSSLMDTLRKELDAQNTSSSSDMQVDDFKAETEQRFERLEAGLVELQSQHVKYEGWFAQMNQQEQFLSQQVQEANARIDQVNGQNEERFSSLQTDMQKGFQHIEALLVKSRRTD